jgi:dephospho-CoA kinase
VPGPWKNGPIPVIGVVGGIGSGKSAVAAAFEGLGAFVIDADKVGHALLDQRPVREQVVARFGPQVLAAATEGEGDGDGDPAPRIDRRLLGAIVFADPLALKRLEAILHPKMRRTFEKAIGRVVRRGKARAVVLDAAILYEAGWDSLCDLVVFVDAPRDQRLARLSAERGWDEAALSAREAAQMPLDAKRARADVVISNTEGLNELQAEAARAWEVLRASAPSRPQIQPRPRPAARAEGDRFPRPPGRGKPWGGARGRSPRGRGR